MPVAQQPSQQHHHHLFSAIGTFLHARHNTSNPNSSSSQGVPPSSSSTPGGYGSSDVPLLYQAFESHLTHRLSSVLPTDDPPCFSLSSFNEFMGLLLATQTDLRPLIPASHAQKKTMDEFLERSVKVLDVCRDIKEQISDVESLQGMLHTVAPCLNPKQGIGINQGSMNRARKILAQLLLHMEIGRGDEGHDHVEMRRSFRGRLRERLSGISSRDGSPQRWRSWHGHQDSTAPPSHGNHNASAPSLHALASSGQGSSSSGHGQAPPLHASTFAGHQQSHGNNVSQAAASTLHITGNSHAHASEVIRALQSLELSLVPPKLGAKDEEECFAAAIYALNVLSVFFLGTFTAAFPSLGIKAHVIASIHPPSPFGWTASFLCLQEKVQEELKVRNKNRVSHAGMWELDVLTSLMKRLLESTSPECFPLSADKEEEVKQLVSQFDDRVHGLERELATFNSQISDFYNRIVAARLEVFDLMNIGNV